MSVDLTTILRNHQKTILAGLDASRDIFENNEAKGDASEFQWVEVVEKFLPHRYKASAAFVLDADGKRSDFIDVVIHDRHYCPLLFEEGDQMFIPAESVYAVLEVKQELSRDTVIYAAEKAESVRRLRRTSTNIVNMGGAAAPRPLFEILAGVLATESGWNPPFGEPFTTALKDGAADFARLDLGCALRHGGFEVAWDAGEPEVNASVAEASLMFFLLRLFGRLQELGTVPAIDLREYGKSLEASTP
ncbi:MAG: DUF6602 domain-containing protein [Thermoleophilaceae bacterium]